MDDGRCRCCGRARGSIAFNALALRCAVIRDETTGGAREVSCIR